MSASEEFAALVQGSAWEVEGGLEVEAEEIEEGAVVLLEKGLEGVAGPGDVGVGEVEGSLEVSVEDEVGADVDDWLEAEVEGGEDWIGEEVDDDIGEGVEEEAEEVVEAEVEAVTEAWDLHRGNHLRWCCHGNCCGSWSNLRFLYHLVHPSLFASCPKPSQQRPPQTEEPPLPHHHLPQLLQTILEVLEIPLTKCLLQSAYTQHQPKNCFDAFAVKEGRENLSLRSGGVQ